MRNESSDELGLGLILVVVEVSSYVGNLSAEVRAMVRTCTPFSANGSYVSVINSQLPPLYI